MSDQPGSGQDPHQQPSQPPQGPPPGFSSGDPLGGASGGQPTPPPSFPPAPPAPSEGGGFSAPAPPAPSDGGGFSAPAPPPPSYPPAEQGGWGGSPEADKGFGATGGLPPGLQGSSSFGSAPAHSGNLATWGNRALAVIIDGLILAIPVIIAIAILSALFASDDDGSSGGLFGGGIVLTILASFLIQLAYYPLMMARQGDKNGQTIGKQVMNVRAVRTDGQPLQLSHAMVREIVGKVIPGSVCGLYTLVDYLWPLNDKQKQALHDKIGNTVVVSTK